MVRWMNALSLASILQEGSRYSNSDSDNWWWWWWQRQWGRMTWTS
jgi:hypothetical protein